jgi:hypothetical protein
VGNINTSSSMTLTTAYASTASSVNDSYMSTSIETLALQQQMSGSNGSLEIIQNLAVSPAVSTSNENLSLVVPNIKYADIGKENQAPMAKKLNDSENPKDLAPKKQNLAKRE